jgi:hypothetical protein
VVDTRCLAEIATTLWRLETKMLDDTGVPLPEFRNLYRHVRSGIDTLQDAGITIQTHRDAPFDPGLLLTVVAYQPSPGLDRERVLETIRPTLYFADRVIQNGEVIVGTPTGEADPPADGDPADPGDHTAGGNQRIFTKAHPLPSSDRNGSTRARSGGHPNP